MVDLSQCLARVETCPSSWLRARWRVSLLMAEAYLFLMARDERAPALIALQRVAGCTSEPAVHPGCAVNVMRAQALLAILLARSGEMEPAHDQISAMRSVYLSAIRAIDRWTPPKIMAEELLRMTRMLRIAEILTGEVIDWPLLLTEEPGEPFSSAARLLCGVQ